ncbi:MAG: hypothetical protein NZ699_11875 [Roseiflexus sp.]|nr:hypothetical protein [Roseiflexus sp.]MCS7289820.1 hypothetical protein [Roseiflexus sp.]MDW8145790.1 hypothetical protein [Roseiflexaceae bacterium]MDW8234412.1 hypothetical protein [Roseiflexaceae bacterium]
MIKQRIASLITAAVFLGVLWVILGRVWVVIWVQVPWWGLLLIGIALFLMIDYLVHRALDGKP